MVNDELPSVSFHDSEVRSVQLDRDGPTVDVEVEVYALTEQAATYRLRFLHVVELELGGLNEQNVLFDLTAVPESDGSFRVTLQPSYGLGASFLCKAIEVKGS